MAKTPPPPRAKVHDAQYTFSLSTKLLACAHAQAAARGDSLPELLRRMLGILCDLKDGERIGTYAETDTEGVYIVSRCPGL
jgi:hypothetical protein